MFSKFAPLITLTLLLRTAMGIPTPEVFYATLGETNDLELEANPTTGYSWMIEQLPSNLILADQRYQAEDNNAGGLGSGGHTVYTFIGQTPGTGELKLIYGRRFQNSTWEPKSISVQVS